MRINPIRLFFPGSKNPPPSPHQTPNGITLVKKFIRYCDNTTFEGGEGGWNRIPEYQLGGVSILMSTIHGF